jgi:hypothetical protein
MVAGAASASNIARWNGSSWQPLDGGIGGTYPSVYSLAVRALAVYDGELIAGGSFNLAGGTPFHNIARWNGTSWQPLDGVTGGNGATVYALTVYRGELIAGGYFGSAGQIAAPRTARWNGAYWQPFRTWLSESGIPTVDPYVSALAVYNGELIAGGNFRRAGGYLSEFWARWGPVCVVADADFDGDGDVDLWDFPSFQLCFNGPNRSTADGCTVDADLDDDGDVDVADFSVFTNCYNGPNRPPKCE